MDHAHSAIEPGNNIYVKIPPNHMKLELTGKMAACEICAQAKIRQANVPKKKEEITNQTWIQGIH